MTDFVTRDQAAVTTPPAGVEVDLTATYDPATQWRIFRDDKEVGTVNAMGPLSALVRFGQMGGYPHNAKWEVVRVR